MILPYLQYTLHSDAVRFRILLFGLKSARQEPLNRINKNLTVDEIKDSCRKAREACLGPHLTIMLVYPRETREDAFNAFGLAKYLFEKGWADTLQATIEIPYPGPGSFKNAGRAACSIRWIGTSTTCAGWS